MAATPNLKINTTNLSLDSDYYPNYTSPTHSIYLSERQQKQQQKRRRTRAQKHLRKPQAFDAYLKRGRSDSISSVSSFDTEDLYQSNNYYQHNCKNDQNNTISPLERPQSPINVSEFLRRVSAVIRFSNLMDVVFADDSNSEIASASCSSDNSEDEWDSETDDNEEFMFMSSASRSRRSNIIS